MSEVIVAIFDAAPSADAAIRDLEAAQIPAAVIRRFVNVDPEHHIIPVPLHDAPRLGSPTVSVVVDEVYTRAVEEALEKRAVLTVHTPLT
jgi:hypothetical protein